MEKQKNTKQTNNKTNNEPVNTNNKQKAGATKNCGKGCDCKQK